MSKEWDEVFMDVSDEADTIRTLEEMLVARIEYERKCEALVTAALENYKDYRRTLE